MYGISNSQQQGGGGGGAASYKAIKSTLTPSDWQEVVGAMPFFVGENAMEWAVNDNIGGMRVKTSSSVLGLQFGVDYTMTISVDNATYTQTAQLLDEAASGGMKILILQFTENVAVYVYDNISGIMPPDMGSSFCAVPGDLTVTSFVITNFEGGDFGTSIQATIVDSAIKVNSAVTMYTNTSEKIAVGEKTNGSITLTAQSVPNVIIPYSLEIVGTDTEGLFELINGYVPDITLPTVPQWHTIYEDTTGTGVTDIDNLTEPLKGGELYRITMKGDFYIFCLPDDGENASSQINIMEEDLGPGNNSLNHKTMALVYHEHSLSLAYVAAYTITETGISDYVFSTSSGIKITKLEVYR